MINYRTSLFSALEALKDVLYKEEFPDIIKNAIKKTATTNTYFTDEHINYSIKNICALFHRSDLEKWLSKYELPSEKIDKVLALVMAGNIPLVGFHDYLCGLLAGFKMKIKLSSSDPYILPAFHAFLCQYNKDLENRVEFTCGTLKNFDIVIATGSNNTSRYFEYYFSKYPHIIRKSRTSCAVLSGNETEEELEKLAEDCLSYFGLGCRSVSKLFVPRFYSFDKLLQAFESFEYYTKHSSYMNNYDYNKALFLINKIPFIESSAVLLNESLGWSSPLSVIYYQYYEQLEEVKNRIEENRDLIQCVVGCIDKGLSFGRAQHPTLEDYADGVDTLQFLSKSIK